ncbi:MAG TPA: protease inhibitor I42 family protein, partial [Candidatus Dependentiae bacterium]|nr:protease inhibitor I42 family protein [Candidatus Dependentiae bacterium]
LALSTIAITQYLYCDMPAYSIYQHNNKNPQTCQQEPSTKTLYIQKGQIFTISLENIYARDYMWYIDTSFFEDNVQLIGKVQMPYRHPGSYGRTIFRFQATKEGQQIITFSYARPWSWRSTLQRTYIINIEKEHSFDKNTYTTIY